MAVRRQGQQCRNLLGRYLLGHSRSACYMSFIHDHHHHIEETDAGPDRPLHLRNKLYDKNLKSQNYYFNILRFPVPWRFALWLYSTSWLDQNLSKRFLKQLTVSAEKVI